MYNAHFYEPHAKAPRRPPRASRGDLRLAAGDIIAPCTPPAPPTRGAERRVLNINEDVHWPRVASVPVRVLPRGGLSPLRVISTGEKQGLIDISIINEEECRGSATILPRAAC
ncbi:unnamed protein product [Pleuronectes platessa]|uniref:Uncharacterized protein n=1 Tax=Pleuronectes platessa TaxID=8262 RepID=A0A9N7VAT9_PLEPL|nr:unnamed protein product [Pleuronectes platessa]